MNINKTKHQKHTEERKKQMKIIWDCAWKLFVIVIVLGWAGTMFRCFMKPFEN